MIINLIILIALVIAGLWTALTARLLRAAVGLTITSAILSMLIYRLGSPLAAVFELSVCAGLIFAIFISTISVTKRINAQELAIRQKQRLHKYWLLPIIVILAATGLSFVHFPTNFAASAQTAENNVKIILWNMRHLDLVGQILILLAGAFGVVVLFKEWKND